MRLIKTITVKVTGDAKSFENFNLDLNDYVKTIRDMGNVYREDDYEVEISVSEAAFAKEAK